MLASKVLFLPQERSAAVVRIRIVQLPDVDEVDGIALDSFEVGSEHEVGNSLGALLLAEGWAEPVPLDAPRPPEPFSEGDPFGTTTLDRNSPPNLVKEQHPPFLDRDLVRELASDWSWRRRRRPWSKK
jgi:hypothetical protein